MFSYEVLKIIKNKIFIYAILFSLIVNCIFCINHKIMTEQDVDIQRIEQTEKINNFSTTIQEVIDQAKKNQEEFYLLGMTDEDYNLRYQKSVVEIYSDVQQNVILSLDIVEGWGSYFAYHTDSFFIFIIVLILSSIIFTQEYATGVYPIISCSKNGNKNIAISKICSVMFIITGIIVLFKLETWLIIGFYGKYSNEMIALQNIDQYLLCPYIISIKRYLIISLFVNIITFFLYAEIIILVSVFVHNYVITFILGGGILGINIFLNNFHYIDTDSPFKNLNLIVGSEVTPLFTRYHALSVMNHVVPVIIIYILLYMCLIIVTNICIVWQYTRGDQTINIKVCNKRNINADDEYKRQIVHKKKIPISLKKSYRYPLFFWEGVKKVNSKKILLILCVLFVIKWNLSKDTFQHTLTYSDIIYHEYMSIMSGPLDDKKQEFLIEERFRINKILDSYENTIQLYLKNEITPEEYRVYLQDYNSAKSKEEYLQIIENHKTYIEYIEKIGSEAWFIYDTGWKVLFFESFDWTLYLAILFLSVGTFTIEYKNRSSSGAFIHILHTTKYGGKRTYWSKYFVDFILSIFIFLIWNAVDILWAIHSYDLPLLQAPLMSIEAFRDIKMNITIFQYLFLFYGIRLLSTIILTIFICILSELLRKTLSVTLTVTVATLLPSIIGNFGVELFQKFDYTAYMCATPMLVDIKLAIINTIIWGIVCIIGICWTWKTWNR